VLNKQTLTGDKKWVSHLEVNRGAGNNSVRYECRKGTEVWSEFLMLHSVQTFGFHVDGLKGCTQAGGVLTS
jgi:hypothetical protein